MAKLNKTCKVCGNKYSFCYSCPTDLNNPTWKMLFDTENCRDIFNILCKESQGKINRDEAYMLLKECDLSQKHLYKPEISGHIDKIMNSYMTNCTNNTVLNDAKIYVEEDNNFDDIEEKSVSSEIATLVTSVLDTANDVSDENRDEIIDQKEILEVVPKKKQPKKMKYVSKRSIEE